ncbi:MAG: SPFH/Band 7/PHB domain protein [Bacillati bacterium ANGP1]|uniref:SPFH/Band 7/PHB domain protein n=1 Tax=Candidatus Segetimicrobium genomatis TaxID=2569760 RepID=A0A537J101_9BACT|nr:MAG: SPFH/Band 7/PHB domain protein [Terrabacteria group bacterium ANGP1]
MPALLGLGYLVAGVIVGISLLSSAIKIVREYQRLVVFRLGRSVGKKGPGVVFLWPVIDRAVWVDLREFFLEIPSQTCITKDNAPINIDFLIYFKVFEPDLSVIQVTDFAGAARGIATTTLRAVVGDISLDDVLAKREQINQVLRTKLDEVTERWGVKVTTVEIREILPPREVQEAMTRQMSAERSRRAVVTEALGNREAAVTVAEGQKQAAILKAEGDRQAAILRAEGFSLALDKIFSVAKNIDSKTLTLQYLEALKALGEGAATKFIFPLEFTKLLQPITDFAKDAGEQK